MRQLKNYRSDNGNKTDPEVKYSGMSEVELKQELIKQVASAKSNGTFSSQQIDDFVKFVSPELDEKSREKLNELVKMIKGS